MQYLTELNELSYRGSNHTVLQTDVRNLWQLSALMRPQRRDLVVVLPSELWISESVKERYARLLDAVFCFYRGSHETDIPDSFAAASQVGQGEVTPSLPPMWMDGEGGSHPLFVPNLQTSDLRPDLRFRHVRFRKEIYFLAD